MLRTTYVLLQYEFGSRDTSLCVYFIIFNVNSFLYFLHSRAFCLFLEFVLFLKQYYMCVHITHTRTQPHRYLIVFLFSLKTNIFFILKIFRSPCRHILLERNKSNICAVMIYSTG